MVLYAVINEADRTKFEKKYQVKYGYHTCPIFAREEAAIGYVEKSPDRVRKDLIVEKIEHGEAEVIYRGQWYDPFLDEAIKFEL